MARPAGVAKLGLMSRLGLETFEHIHLDDSFFLGLMAVGTGLRLRVLFALEPGHRLYAPPQPGEQHCYREGDVLIAGFRPTQWRPGRRPSILIDPDGTLDLGSISVEIRGEGYWIGTEWFDVAFAAESVTAVVDGPSD